MGGQHIENTQNEKKTQLTDFPGNAHHTRIRGGSTHAHTQTGDATRTHTCIINLLLFFLEHKLFLRAEEIGVVRFFFFVSSHFSNHKTPLFRAPRVRVCV